MLVVALLTSYFAAPSIPQDEALAAKLSVDLKLHLASRRAPRQSEPAKLFTVRFDAPLSDRRVRELEALGIQLERFAGEVTHVGPFYGVRVTDAAWDALLGSKDVRRIMLPAPRRFLANPLSSEFDLVDRLTGAFELWSRRAHTGARLTGQGIVFADMDSGVDLFHPLFFKPDGGYYSWLDVDGDDSFEPGTDGVDLDENGVISAAEVLEMLGGGLVDWDGTVSDAPTHFVPGRCWLYTDSDGDSERDYGPDAGFDDDTPAFGEPLFLADDVDRDGLLDPEEKIIRLATSKIRRVIREYSGEVYTRSVDLIDTPIHDEVSHGTGTAGVLLGGAYGLTQIQGVAPDADLIMIDQARGPGDPDEPAQTTVWAADLAETFGAQILLHEYGTHVHRFGDGSDDWEVFIDELSAAGVAQATANHNFAGVSGNAVFTVAASTTRVLPMRIDGWGGYPLAVFLTVRWRGGFSTAVSGTLVTPGGAEIPMTVNGNNGNYYAFTADETSSRGTSMLGTYLLKYNGTSYVTLDSGLWGIRLANTTGSDIEIFLTVGDDTGYASFVYLTEEVSDATTMAWPATADTAISVGASVGNFHQGGETEGGLKSFSGRGPRIDGARGVDVVAPDDDFTAVPSATAGQGHYQIFGGTSGALPQVAGAIGLLLQNEPDLTPAELKDRVVSSAVEDSLTGTTPNPVWGGGKLALHRLVFGTAASSGASPEVRLTDPSPVYRGEVTELDAAGSTSAEFDVADLIFRWDVDYDGAWDATVNGDPTTLALFDELGTWRLKIEVEDPRGLSNQGIFEVVVVEPPEPDAGAPPGDGDQVPGDGPGGCGCHARAPSPLFFCALAVAILLGRARRALSSRTR